MMDEKEGKNDDNVEADLIKYWDWLGTLAKTFLDKLLDGHNGTKTMTTSATATATSSLSLSCAAPSHYDDREDPNKRILVTNSKNRQNQSEWKRNMISITNALKNQHMSPTREQQQQTKQHQTKDAVLFPLLNQFEETVGIQAMTDNNNSLPSLESIHPPRLMLPDSTIIGSNNNNDNNQKRSSKSEEYDDIVVAMQHYELVEQHRNTIVTRYDGGDDRVSLILTMTIEEERDYGETRQIVPCADDKTMSVIFNWAQNHIHGDKKTKAMIKKVYELITKSLSRWMIDAAGNHRVVDHINTLLREIQALYTHSNEHLGPIWEGYSLIDRV